MGLGDRLQHAWNAFMNRDPTVVYRNIGPGYSLRPDRKVPPMGNDKSIVTSVINRMATDAAAITVEHVRLDENDRFKEVVDSGLNYCVTVEANLDQSARAFKQDIYQTMLEKGVVAIVPVDTSTSPKSPFEIRTMRVGEVLEWYPEHVKLKLYNQRTAKKEEIILPKTLVGIVENPFFSVMNAPNSTMRRLIHKLSLLDYVDEQSGSGKLDLIIQLPYVIKSDARKQQASERANEIKTQLANSDYGIAYTDGTEKITQLNRSVENTLPERVESLTEKLYAELGMNQDILNGTANESTMTNYYVRTIEVVVEAVVEELSRKFLTKTARTQKQTVTYFRDPFKLVSPSNMADAFDKLGRNAIFTSNESRQELGLKPSSDPIADALINKNMPFGTQTINGANQVPAEEVSIGDIPVSQL